MSVYSLDGVLRLVATTSISGYQKYISPYKGFRCAHRALHGGESCSEYIKNAIATQGLVAGIKISSQRFKACEQAYKTLRSSLPRLNNHPTTTACVGDRCDDVKICCCAVDACPCNGTRIDQ